MNKKTAVRLIKGAATATGVAAVAASAAYVGYDVYKNLSIKSMPQKPEKEIEGGNVHKLLMYLDNPKLAKRDGVVVDGDYVLNAIIPVRDFVAGRYDCQDFRMQTVTRLLYLYEDKIKELSPESFLMIRDIYLNAKYWMTEPGADSACYWSENHQLLYAVWEYLAGQRWYNETFFNDGATGKEHMERGRKRINAWMEHRFYHGFSEFNSSNYYMFNFGPAANFIQFASPRDADMVERMKMCIDLLIHDVVSNMFEYSFIAPTGRAYVDNLNIKNDRIRPLVSFLWGLDKSYTESDHHMLVNVISMMNAKDEHGKPKKLYTVPPVLLDIGRDVNSRVIRQSSGMDTSELAEKGLVGDSDEQIMAQLGMEAFTNPEVIHNTVSYIRKHDMFTNDFVNFFKILNLRLLRGPVVSEAMSRYLKPMPNGIAIERANQYSYRTEHFCLSAVQKYRPGGFGAQQLLSNCRLSGGVTVFTAHPAKEQDEKSVKAVPGYWAGFGRSAHIAQEESVQLQLFRIPRVRGFLELYAVPQYTHTLFPQAFFDESVIDGSYAFAKKNGAFIALIGNGIFRYNAYSEYSAQALNCGLEEHPDKDYDLLQFGSDQFVIYELSDCTRESFEEFIQRIKSNTVEYNGKDKLCYESRGKTYSLKYNREFSIDGIVKSPQGKRFESDYIVSEREADEMLFSYNGHSLKLDFPNAVREVK